MDFGMATVCRPGYRVNKRWRGKRGQRQCLKGEGKKTLKELQAIAMANDISIFKRRKDDMGFTKTPLTARALKYRLTKMKVPYGSEMVAAPLGGDGLGGLAFPRPGAIAGMDFGDTVCPPGFSPNPMWQRKRGQRQCLKDGTPASLKAAMRAARKPKVMKKKMTLKDLQKLAMANDVSIFKRRKDDMGFTKTPLSEKALKYRLTKMRVRYK